MKHHDPDNGIMDFNTAAFRYGCTVCLIFVSFVGFGSTIDAPDPATPTTANKGLSSCERMDSQVNSVCLMLVLLIVDC